MSTLGSRMHCPYCESADTRVVDSRRTDAGRAIRRRRSCPACGQRFTTFERADIAIQVIKRDGRTQPFDAEKMRSGIESALADRPLPDRDVDQLVAEIEGVVRAGPPMVSADDIGRAVLDGLRELDEVAYLRFASVYKEFQGASDFEREVAAMEDGTTVSPGSG
jgi:transcriptional repressor NrdR